MDIVPPMLPRRSALALLGTGLAATGMPPAGWTRVAAAPPMLGTPDQLEAERFILRVLQDAELIRVQRGLRAELLRGPIGRTPDGAATVERAIAQWTNSLLFAEASEHRKRPVFLWGTDDTPRSWFGHTLGGVGTSGDNPDAIYRTAVVDGSRTYELLGQIDRRNPAAQLVLEIDKATLSNPSSMMDMVNGKPEMISVTLKLMTDRDLRIAPDGSFRLTLGPQGEVPLKPGTITVGTRDMLADWRQRPARLAIRELGVPQPRPVSGLAFEPLDYAALRRHAIADLPGYVHFWSKFPENWFGGLAPNTISQPQGRNGGWGYVAGMRFALQPDEAIVVTTGQGGAAYTGFQLNDPWMIAPDARTHQVCLNRSQVTPNADGTVTYVIAARDPGVANWLDTVGCNSGLGILRWQALPPGTGKDGLIQDFRKVKLAEVAGMRRIPRVTPAQRRHAVAVRAAAYASRAT